MSKLVRCPQCQKEAPYSQENPFRPFCSERCKLIDFGDWASEKYAIPAQDEPDPDEEDFNKESDEAKH